MSAPNAAITHEVNEVDTTHFGRVMAFVPNERDSDSINVSSRGNTLHSSTRTRISVFPQYGAQTILNVQKSKVIPKQWRLGLR